MKFLRHIFLLVFLFSFVDNSSATDQLNCKSPPTITISASGIFTIQRDSPVNEIITPWFSATSYPYAVCTPTGNAPFTVGIAASKPPTNNVINTDGVTFKVYETNIDGIGYIIKSRDRFAYSHGGWDSGWSAYLPKPDSTTMRSIIGGWSVNIGTEYNTGLDVAVAFVRYADSKSGTVSGGVIANGTAGEDPVFGNPSSPIQLNSSLKINTVACSITSEGSLAFPIGDVSASQFNSTGTVSQQSSTVNLEVDCDADTNINITLDGTQNPDSSNKSVLMLSSQGQSGVADGVGVQLLYNGTPLELNKMISIKTSTGGQESLPITARYFQTKEQVRSGTANATATLNLTYQ